MGRPLKKKYFKNDTQLVGHTVDEDGDSLTVPIFRQSGTLQFVALIDGFYKKLKLVEKELEDLEVGEIAILGRDSDEIVDHVEWLKGDVTRYLDENHKWYVSDEDVTVTDDMIEIESVDTIFDPE